MSVYERRLSHRRSNKGCKERQEPTLGVVCSEVSVEREFCLQIFFLTVFRFLPKVGMLFFNNNFLFIIAGKEAFQCSEETVIQRFPVARTFQFA